MSNMDQTNQVSFCECCGNPQGDLDFLKTNRDLSTIKDKNGAALDIVIIDDDEADALLTLELLESKKILNKPKIFRKPRKALDYLIKSHDLVDHSLPDLVLLDYFMPSSDGLEILKELRENPSTHNIPIFMLTNSDDQSFVAESTKYKVNGILKKPINVGALLNLILTLPGFGLILGKRCSHIN